MASRRAATTWSVAAADETVLGTGATASRQRATGGYLLKRRRRHHVQYQYTVAGAAFLLIVGFAARQQQQGPLTGEDASSAEGPASRLISVRGQQPSQSDHSRSVAARGLGPPAIRTATDPCHDSQVTAARYIRGHSSAGVPVKADPQAALLVRARQIAAAVYAQEAAAASTASPSTSTDDEEELTVSAEEDLDMPGTSAPPAIEMRSNTDDQPLYTVQPIPHLW